MSLRVTRNPDHQLTTRFDKLKPGDCFKYDGRLFMRVSPFRVDSSGVVCLDAPEAVNFAPYMTDFAPATMVTPVTVELTY